MPRWLISVPAWGAAYVDLARTVALPSIAAAARCASNEATFVVYTDRPDAFDGCFGGFPYEVRPVREGLPASYLSPLHREVLKDAKPGDFFSPLNADCFLSRETLRAAEGHFAQGKRIIACAPTRATGVPPAPGADAAAVIDFLAANPHPVTVHATWSTYATALPAAIYLREGENFACNTSAMHPVGFVVPAQPIPFRGAVDDDLHRYFEPTDYHVVTSPELVVIEISPSDLSYPWELSDASSPDFLVPKSTQWIVDWMLSVRIPIERWFFRQRVLFRGDPDGFMDDPIPGILAKLDIAENGDIDAIAKRRVFSGDGYERVHFMVNRTVEPADEAESWPLLKR